jgi:SpoVK/Ycf46/Vps4 family AAA+-type ATPase
LAGAGGGGGTNETTVRVAAKFLQWLQDHESQVFVVATCNDIKTLAAASDGAFIRPGRWDGVFFIDNPDTEQGREILDLYLKEFTGAGAGDYLETPNLKDYSGAEIRQVAIETAYNGGDLAAAAAFVKPISKTNKEALDALSKWAAGRTEPAHIPAAADTKRAINLQ